jgi:hypothetical protein
MMPDEPPPFLRTWRRVYTFVLCYLVCLIAAFRWFTVHFAP